MALELQTIKAVQLTPKQLEWLRLAAGLPADKYEVAEKTHFQAAPCLSTMRANYAALREVLCMENAQVCQRKSGSSVLLS